MERLTQEVVETVKGKKIPHYVVNEKDAPLEHDKGLYMDGNCIRRLADYEDLMEDYEIESLLELRKILWFYYQTCHLKEYCKRDEKFKKELLNRREKKQ